MARTVKHTFNLLAVPGSIIARTSLTSWLTLGPTSPAPMRSTMLLGLRLTAAVFGGGACGPFRAPTCVRFLVRLRAMVWAMVLLRYRPHRTSFMAGREALELREGYFLRCGGGRSQ